MPASRNPDRGVQYASIAYRQRLADRGITISMSRPGNPFDNAKAESFMKTLKTEEINGRAFADINDARRRIIGFIAEVYNKDRLHSALGYQSPLSSKPRSRKTKHDNASWQPHCHRNYRVSFQGAVQHCHRNSIIPYSAACSSGAVRGRIIWIRVPPPGSESRSSRPPSRLVTML
jgi:Integrase core domain